MSAESKDWSISALSKELDVDRRTVARRIAGVPPCRKTKVGNLYKMRDVCVQVCMPGLLEAGEPGDVMSLDAERARLAHFQAIEKELIVNKLEASLVPMADVERILGVIIATAKSRLVGLGNRLAQQLAAAADGGPGSLQQVVDTATEEILHEMASVDLGVALDLPAKPGPGSEPDGGVAAAGKTGDKPVGRKVPVPKP